MIGQPFDMPLEVLAKDMSTVNFSSARIGLLPFYRSCRIKADKFAGRWSRTIRWWLSRERLRARDDPKRWTTAFPERFWTHSLLVNAWDYTDPVSEAQSDLLQISMRTKSPQMVMTERGRDIKQIERDFEEYGDPDVLSTMTRDPTPEVPPPTANPPQPTKDANANP
jgi:capsid protein